VHKKAVRQVPEWSWHSIGSFREQATDYSWPSAAITFPPSQAGRPQAAADLADAAARSRDRFNPLALSDDDAGLIGID
jgi:hypothetical protein